MKYLLLFLLPLFLTAAEETMTIKTLDGRIFQNAVVEGVNAGGIDIGYVNESGHYVLRGLRFKDLPEDLQKQFGYDPDQEKKFETEVKKFSGKDIDKVAGDEKARLERITELIKAKFAGEKITLKPADLKFAVHAGRRSVELSLVKDVKSGCIVQINKLISGDPIPSKLVMLDGIHIPGEGTWSGFIYPAGVRTVYNKEQIPVYTGGLEESAALLNKYLEIYAEYAAEKDAPQPQKKPQQVEPPDQWTSGSDTISGGTVLYGFGNGYYFIAGNYIPVWWWNNNRPCPPHPPRPPRPHPPRPPKPPRPDKPDRPGKPDRPDKPDRPGKPDRPDKPDRPGKPDRPDKPDRPGKPDRPDKPDRPPVSRPPVAVPPGILTLPSTPSLNPSRPSFPAARGSDGGTTRNYEIRRSGTFRSAAPR